MLHQFISQMVPQSGMWAYALQNTDTNFFQKHSVDGTTTTVTEDVNPLTPTVAIWVQL